jgi:hypothetical protein
MSGAYLTKWAKDPNATARLKTYMDDYVAKAPLPIPERWLARVQRLFAVIYASAAQAIDYDVLPWSKAKTLEAIKTCMHDAMDQLMAKSAAIVDGVTPHRSNDSLLAEFKQRITDANFIRLGREAERKKVTFKRLRRADGVVRPTKSGRCEYLLFANAMEGWFPAVSDRQRLVKHLSELNLLNPGRRPDTATKQTFVAEFGKKVPCYGVRRRRIRDFAI